MSKINIIIKERPADIGNFSVGRLLPFRSKRMIGPFIFLDHMGPAQFKPNENVDVAPHPHIGLSTLTFLLEGSLMHRDSLGNALEILPGEVNWMTAGKGIVHSERTPESLRNTGKSFHGLQFWIALPVDKEQMEPDFVHVKKDSIPSWSEGDISFKLIAGEALGKISPVPVYSRLFFIEVNANGEKSVKLRKQLYGEIGIYILKGKVKSENESFEANNMLVLNNPDLELELSPGTLIYLIGGEPFPEERFIYWNFVSSSKSLIEDAKLRWQKQFFPKIPGETGFIPLPAK